MKIGTFHNRPCVRTIWPGSEWGRSQIRWYPVLGPPHSDAEIIRFHPRHWHVDFRFLRKRERQMGFYRRTARSEDPISDVFVVPVTTVFPDLPGNPVNINVDDLPDGRYPVESYLRTMRRRYNGPYPEYPRHVIPWLPELQDAYRDQRLGPDLTCPHRGAPLGEMEPEEDGCVTCPLHGLRWDPRTGMPAWE